MHNEPEPEISIFDLWKIVAGGWFVLLVSMGVGLALALMLGAVLDTMYRAETVFVEADSQQEFAMPSGGGLLGGLAALAGIQGGAGASGGPVSAATILQSRTFAERFITRNNLMPELYPKLWDSAKGAWRAGVTPPPLWQGAAVLRKRIDFAQANGIPGASLVSVSWQDPERAAYLADDLIRLANEMARERDIADAERSIAYVHQQMERTNIVELERVLYGLLESEQKTLMLANAREDYAFEILDPAIVPDYPYQPNMRQIVVAGLAAGVFFGVLFVFVRALVRRWRREQGLA